MNAKAKRMAAIVLSWLTIVLCASAHQQTTNNIQAANQSHGPLKVTNNLVLVRVVVRDAQGKPVEGLKKEDFRLFDQGKEQVVTEFESGGSAAIPDSYAMNVSATPATSGVRTVAGVLPEKFLALYFDDLDTSEADMAYAREVAAQYLASGLDSQEQVAIVTPEKMLIDFTSDRKRIDEALSALHVGSRSLTSGTANCPNLSDYQALEITRNTLNRDTEAWRVALDEAAACGGTNSGSPTVAPAQGRAAGATLGPSNQLSSQVLQVAQNIVSQMQARSRTDLRQLGEAVNYVSKMPGQRAVILVSSGFLAEDDQALVDRVIDRSLRSQVVISSLDAKVPLMSERGASQRPTAVQRLDEAREKLATEVLAEVAEGTGGAYIHDANDLKAGLSKLAGDSAYYILGFAPSNMKPDGKFHAIKVTLAESQVGLTLQARRGYFTPASEAEAEAEIEENELADAEAEREEQVRKTLFSTSDVAQFPLDLRVNVSRRQKEVHDVSLHGHIDGEKLQLAKDGEHNRNTVSFFFAVFDPQGNAIASQAREMKIDVVDSQVEELRKTGLDLDVTFQLKPGTYRVREVATESEGREIAAVSRNVEIPGHEKELSASVRWDPPDVDASVSHISSSVTCSLPDVLAVAAGPAEALVDNLQNFDAREQIRYEQTDGMGEQLLSVNANFDYLVDFTKNGRGLSMREIRTPLPGTDASLKDSVSDEGLPVLALIFAPWLRSDYEMRCEGMGSWENRPAWVIYFRQQDGKPPRTAAIPTATKVRPVSLKGRAWIATDSGEVMHLETNLVKGTAVLSMQSREPVLILGSTVSVDYAPVKFTSKNVVLWLPRSAVTFTDYGDRRMIIQHTFSNFQLFSVQAGQTIQAPKP